MKVSCIPQVPVQTELGKDLGRHREASQTKKLLLAFSFLTLWERNLFDLRYGIPATARSILL